MNFASWVILGVVIAIVALAARATFSKKGGAGSCHGCSGCEHASGAGCPCTIRLDEDALAALPDSKKR